MGVTRSGGNEHMHIISEHMGTQEVMGRRLGPKYGRLGRYQHVWDAWSPAAAADGRREAIPVPMADRSQSSSKWSTWKALFLYTVLSVNQLNYLVCLGHFNCLEVHQLVDLMREWDWPGQRIISGVLHSFDVGGSEVHRKVSWSEIIKNTLR